ncbi:MAG: glycosyltransferase family 4 protein, partial [Gammaproteobacteria bacterium]|nr:glycosyltransferase family 4 protein [Gammaproteobacteria bacterium]
IAQLIPRKGHRYFLEAMPGLLQSFKNLRVLFCGQGACEKEIRGQIERMGLGHAVTLAGFRNDLDKILPCLDLLVHPATSEGLGVSLLQASQAGLPVVASNVGGIPEAISDGISGLLVPPENPVELQRAVERILNDSLLAQRLGNQGIDHVKKNFSVEKMVDGNLAVYNLV